MSTQLGQAPKSMVRPPPFRVQIVDLVAENGAIAALNDTQKPELHRVGPPAPHRRPKGAREVATIPRGARSRSPISLTVSTATANLSDAIELEPAANR